ncbi:MAG TPA: metallophosphoesterase [Candidatus Dormibacteraeota bacterium]|nr:metallophosphoesterase [Candidatus Dormibacteraeota bacterium]
MALRLLHFADLHLDRSFASERLSGAAASRRREDLRGALSRIVGRAREESVDLITCAGDLFEHDQVTRDTANFVLQTLGEAGRPVLISPGHSDPALPGSPYRYMRWPNNVTIATHEELRPYEFGGVSVWAAGFMRPGVTDAPLRNFARLEQGINLLMLHASDMSALPPGTLPLKPLTPDQVREAGFRHGLLGHYHEARSGDIITYPGSPEPLGETDAAGHGTALVGVDDEGGVTVRLENVAQGHFSRQTIDLTGMTGAEQLRDALRAAASGEHRAGSSIVVILIGRRPPSLKVDIRRLAEECGDGIAQFEIEDRSHAPHDLEAVAQEFTSRGEMVRKLVERQPDSAEDREAVGRALQLALDAFEP